MAAPDQQMNLGTEALNGADGDTARAAATKYNTHVHQTTDVQDAIDGAATPSGSNVFATMADIPPDELTSNELQAIQNANSPGPSNEFATALDIPTTTELAAIQGAAAPSGYNVFATMADVGGGGAYPPYDWMSDAAVVTDFSSGYPDLAVADEGSTAGNLGTAGGGAMRRFSSNNTANLVGVLAESVSSGNFVVAIRMKTGAYGIDFNTTMYAGAFVAFWDGTDTSTNSFYAVGPFRRTHDQDSGGIARINGTGRPALTSLAATVQAAGPGLGDIVDVVVARTSTTLTMYAGPAGGNLIQMDTWTVSTGAGTIGIVAGGTAPATTWVDVVGIATSGTFTSMPLIASG